MACEDKASFIEKRLFERQPVPEGTTAHFRNDIQGHDFAYVRNISENGMLICAHFPRISYQTDSILNDIFICISNKAGDRASLADSSINFVIDHAKIVRYSPGYLPYTSFYGVSFSYESVSVKEMINAYVNNSHRLSL